MRLAEGKIIGFILLVMVSISAVSTECFGALIKMDLIELWNYAEVVLIGEVTNITTHEAPRDTIYSNVEVKVETYIKNPLNRSEVVIQVGGGTIGEMRMWVEDQPDFELNERVLVFLCYCTGGITFLEVEGYQVVGGPQGKFVETNGIWKGSGERLELSDLYGLPGAVPPPPPLPPILSNLTMTPAEVELGENVTIGFVNENIDSQSFTYIVGMQIGDLALSIDVELEASESKAVSRTITPDTVGHYDVWVDGLIGGFEVAAASPSQKAIVSAVAAVIGGVIGVWWVKRKQKKRKGEW